MSTMTGGGGGGGASTGGIGQANPSHVEHSHSHGAPSSLPVVQYSVVDFEANIPPAVHDKLSESYGFNNGQEWSGAHGEGKAPTPAGARYMRWLQPMEADLARQVEYDMDDQDHHWLDELNKDRKKDNRLPVSYETFEIIMDKLEKEWFDLMKKIPKKASALPTEDSKCAICDDGECENSNAIVFCDGCNLAVHQDCYGVPYIPEGQWLCRKCTVSPDKPVNCVLCPNSYGAFKQTTTAQWAHLLCAIWVPDTGVSNTVYMEPIDGVENISKNRWKLVCYLCKKKVGACIQCANRNCFAAFHVTCARERKLDLKMKQGTERGELRAYCEKHSENFVPPANDPQTADADVVMAPIVKRSHKRGGGTIVVSQPLLLNLKRNKAGRATAITLKSATGSKSARAYKKTYTSGPPLVPLFVFDKVLAYAGRIKMAKKSAFVNQVCRYWSLKREARRGAPLLKRLHLEPWTASGTTQQQTDAEKEKKLELTRLLRRDLEKVRMLTERVRKREKKKLERALLFKSLLEDFVYPKEKAMSDALEKIAALDKQRYFALPVSRIAVPDYYDIIKHPMDWQTMQEKLDRHEYLTCQDFQDDVEIVINNARRYNKKDSPVHRSAVRVNDGAEPILAALEKLDDPDSEAYQHATLALELLTPEMVDQLFDFHYDPIVKPPPTPKPAQVAKLLLQTGKGKETGGDGEASGSRPRTSKKRTSELAGLLQGVGDGVSTPLRSSRAKSELLDLQSSAGPSATSSRPNPREAARLRAEAKAVDASPNAKAGPSKSKGQLTPTSAAVAAARVEDVDPKASFKLFEKGWVLPEGSSRRRSAVSVPRGHVASATAVQAEQDDLSSLSSVSSRSSSRERSTANIAVSSSTTAPPMPTASASRSRSYKSKEKAAQSAAEAEEAAVVSVLKSSKGKGKQRATQQDGPQADIGMLDEDVQMVDVDFEKSKSQAPPGSPVKLPKTHEILAWKSAWKAASTKMAVTDKSKQAGDGTLVWARLVGYPFWPAEVLDPEDPETPASLVKSRPTDIANFVLVMFFDNQGTGGWIPLHDIFLLGEDKEFDQLNLSPAAIASRRNKTKSKSVNQTIRELTDGYRRACVNIEVVEEGVHVAATDSEAKSPGKSKAKRVRRR